MVVATLTKSRVFLPSLGYFSPSGEPLTDPNQKKTYSLPNVHGDVFVTTNAIGNLTGTFMTGPFGEPLTGQTDPNNTISKASYSYLGQHEKLTETDFSLDHIPTT